MLQNYTLFSHFQQISYNYFENMGGVIYWYSICYKKTIYTSLRWYLRWSTSCIDKRIKFGINVYVLCHAKEIVYFCKVIIF